MGYGVVVRRGRRPRLGRVRSLRLRRSVRRPARFQSVAKLYKRRRPATGFKPRSAKRQRTLVRPKRKVQDDGGFFSGQYKKVAFKYGKKKSILSTLRKLELRNHKAIWFRFGAANRFTQEGYFKGDYITNSSSAGASWVPISVLEVTSKPFSNDIVGSKTRLPFHRFFCDSNGDMKVVSVQGHATDGTSGRNGFEVYKGESYGAHHYWDHGVLEWVNLKFLFKCARARPGTIKIHMVQFTDEKLVPQVGTYGPGFDSFWQRVLKEQLYNPIVKDSTPFGRKYMPGVRVLKTWQKNWAPDSNTNLDSQGQQVRFDIFARLNRFCNFTKRQGNEAGSKAAIDDDAYINEVEQADGSGASDFEQFNSPPRHESRVYFIITNTNYDQSAASFNDAIHVSYDMECRTKWVYR